MVNTPRPRETFPRVNAKSENGTGEHVPYVFRQLRRARGRNLRGCGSMSSLLRAALCSSRAGSPQREGRDSTGEKRGPTRANFTPWTHHREREGARRDGEKVAALSKRRCSRVEDSRGTTLRERHSGVEHAAAPFGPWNCACVHLWFRRLCVRACGCAVRVSMRSRVCAREFLP